MMAYSGVFYIAVVMAALCFSFSRALTHEMVKEMIHGETVYMEDYNELLSPECNRTIKHLASDMNVTTFFKVLDAAGKPGAGILVGNVHMLGHYDECESITDFKYCMMSLDSSYSAAQGMAIPVTYGLCVPENCSEMDVLNVAHKYIDADFLNVTTIPVCTQHPHRSFDWKFKLTVAFFSLLFLLVITSSLYHAWYHSEACKSARYSPLDEENVENERHLPPDQVLPGDSEINKGDPRSERAITEGKRLKIFNQIAFSFALPQNFPKLLSVKLSNDSIACINGIRVISMLWVILGHAFSLNATLPSINPLTGLSWFSRYGFMFLANAYFSVDSFFVMSGLLVTYITLKQLKRRNGKLPWRWFYFHRYWRLSPALAATMLFYVYILPYFGNGPFAQSLAARPNCPKYWWSNLLYINNFYPVQEANMCIPWVWYLANDMQFFAISPLILVPLFYIPWLGFCLIATLCFASVVTTGVLTSIYNFQSASNAFQVNPQTHGNFMDIIYTKPYCRITPYLAGMVVGYIFYRYPKKSIKIHWTIALTSWILACGIGYACIYCVYPNYTGHSWSTGGNIMYQAFCRLLWGISLSWIIFACHYGYGGWVNSFLGHPLWAPLGRLTYTAYLLHLLVAMVFSGNVGTTTYVSLSLTSFNFAGIALISYGCAAVLSLMLEFPLVGLEKLFIPRN